MKKRKSIVVVLLCVMAFCACGKKNTRLEDYPELIGRWQCAEAGNPGIAGELQIISDKEIQLTFAAEEGDSTLIFYKVE